MGNGRKKQQCCVRRKGDEQTPLLGQNLLSRRLMGLMGQRSMQEEIASTHHPYSPAGTTVLSHQQDKTISFCFLVLPIFLPSSSCNRSHLWVQEEILARELMLTWDRSQQLLCKDREQPLCFSNPGTDRRGRWSTEKLMGKGEGRRKRGSSSWRLTLFYQSWHTCVSHFQMWGDTSHIFWSVPTSLLIFHEKLQLVLGTYYLMKGRERIWLLAEFIFRCDFKKKWWEN